MDTEMEFEAFSQLTNIQSFFYGRSVFLTGVTGLVGKVLLEKLLRCCPGIGMIYVLIRSKKNLTAEQRLEKIFKLELFKKCREVFPNFSKRITIVEGDLTMDGFGISHEDFEKMANNVSVVLHSAASVNFKEPLKSAVEHNLIATRRMMELALKMPHLISLVHVSTAYVKREEDGSVLEKIPQCKVTPQQLLEALKWMDDASIEAVTEFLLEKKLTTYLVTKALGEMVVAQTKGDLSVAIVRPCYVTPTCKEPFPGWIDSIQGMSGLMLAGAKGALRTLRSVKSLKLNIIPVDIVVNTIIASAWHVGTEQPSSIFIVHCVFDYEKLPYADQDILNYTLEKRSEYPLVNMFRYPHFTIYYNKYAYYLHSLIDQWIPAVIIDFFLYIFTGRTILIKVYKKIEFMYGIFYRLGKDPWVCRMENFRKLQKRLCGEDAEIFSLNTENFNWHEYLDHCFLGGRKYLAREDPSNIPYAKKKAKIWWAVTTFLKWCIILYFFYYVSSGFISRSQSRNVEDKMYTIKP